MLKLLYFNALLLLVISFHVKVNAQDGNLSHDSAVLNSGRLHGLLIGGGVAYAGSMTGLYHLWYKNYPQSSFHFINDNNEWLFMDKFGHATSTYYIGLIGYESLKWAGVDERKSAIYGGGIGFFYLTVIEILDGFSKEWGASGGDLIANSAGTALFISQQLAWKEQRIKLKWSFHPTKYAQYNPEQLGSNFATRMIKDYNGQTMWLSANVSSFMPEKSRFPKWLNIAVGYGAEGMTGAITNPSMIDGHIVPGFDRYRQFYLAPDIDLGKIETRYSTLNFMLKMVGFIKVPLPALEINKNGVKFHPVYF
jgi:hypothetical protein